MDKLRASCVRSLMFWLGLSGISCAGRGEASSPAAVALDRTYAPTTRLFVAHYPRSFAASLKSDGLVVFLAPSGAAPVSRGAALILTGNPHPISSDVAEYERVLLESQQSKLPDFKTSSLEATTCLGKFPGLRRRGRYHGQVGQVEWASCTFLAKGHGFSFAYVSDASADATLLQRIVDATEIND
jgi:hypothetical protein